MEIREIKKSSRHSKITGDFAESLVLYWLSKYGFECAKVDHTGIDLIARNNETNELMGISVKGRSRSKGKEEEFVSIRNDVFEKAKSACDAFGCVPYFAIVVDRKEKIMMFILRTEKLLRLFPRGQTASGWKMTKKWLNSTTKLLGGGDALLLSSTTQKPHYVIPAQAGIQAPGLLLPQE